MTTIAGDPLLTLSTIPPKRAFIEIDDVRYELAAMEDFGLVETARILRVKDEIETASKAPDTNDPALVEAVARQLRELVGQLLQAPPEIIDKLTDYDRLAVVDVFTRAVRTAVSKKAPNRATRRKSRSTGDASSRRSARRTAPATG